MIVNTHTKVEASLGFTRNWDAREAGREVVKTAIKGLNQPPSFFLLFATIHYKDRGGFKQFLRGVWDVLPKNTPLIGGTVSSFINNFGCFTQGATALAVAYPNMDIAVGIGKRTKISPNAAAKKCGYMIYKRLKNSKYKNKFLINLIAGPTIPKLPLSGRLPVIKSKSLGNFIAHYLVRLFPYMGHGLGRETDILDKLSAIISDYDIVGISSTDRGEMLNNYQFFGEDVYVNSVIGLGCAIDLPISINSKIASHATDKKFRITGSCYKDQIITKIDGKPAKNRYFEVLDISEGQFIVSSPFIYKILVYFPLSFEGRKEHLTGAGAFLGDNVVISPGRIGSNNVNILSVNGKEIVDHVKNVINTFPENLPFMFVTSSVIYSYILGGRTYDIKKKMDNYLGDIPYLILGSQIENIRCKSDNPSVRIYSFNGISVNNETISSVSSN